MFRILVYDEDLYDHHEGEEWDDVKEVLVTANTKILKEYRYLFTGMIRSIWKEVDTEIYILVDVSNMIYLDFFKDLVLCLEGEGINLILDFKQTEG
ncbi:MAG: hypothetical protein M0P12_01075 [Paludibacteraceae bacterium]|nr:hypothetical protein [Paludibacteraceae bacterium]